MLQPPAAGAAPAVDVSQWDDFYPDRCAIETQTQTRNARNEVTRAWAPVAGLESVPCAVRFARGSEAFAGGATGGAGVQSASASHVLKLQGHYPAIKPQQRATVTDSLSGKTASYDIIAVAHTSGKSRTKIIATNAVN